MVVRLEVGLDGAHVAGKTFRPVIDNLLHEILREVTLGFVTEPARGRHGSIDGQPKDADKDDEETHREDRRQLGADGTLTANLALGDAVHVLRHERAPVAIGRTHKGVTAFAEEIFEEAHVQSRTGWAARARAGAAMRRTSKGKSRPTQEALLGIRLVSVMPGIVLISRK